LFPCCHSAATVLILSFLLPSLSPPPSPSHLDRRRMTRTQRYCSGSNRWNAKWRYTTVTHIRESRLWCYIVTVMVF
jgi:hypothetical protein